MRHLKSLSLILIFLSVGAAHADVLVEPYLGYGLGTRGTGVLFGGRVGYRMLGLMASLDYQTGRGRDTSHPSNSTTPSNLGVTVGYTLPILFRAYLGYIPLARLTAEHGGYNHTFDGGEAVKYGVGFTGFPFIVLNAEYIHAHYKGLDADTYGVNVSLPLGF